MITRYNPLLAILRSALAWDKAKPAGSQKLRLSDEEIRDNWDALNDALDREHTFPGVMGSTGGIHTFVVDTSAPSGYEGRLAIVNDVLQWYSNSAWRTLIPVGTKMAFFQASVPTGWTQDVTQNDKVLRVVSGSGGGAGGSWTISGVTTGSSNIGYATNYAILGTGGTVMTALTSSGAHTHTLSADGAWRPAYIDVVIGTKD